MTALVREIPSNQEEKIMIRIRQLTVPAIVLIFGMCLSLPGSAAPAPKLDSAARKKLEVLKKKLQPAVVRFCKELDSEIGKVDPEVRLARVIGPAKAKITFYFKVTMFGDRFPRGDSVLSVYLSYYDGRWTAESHSDWGGSTSADADKIMLLIDEAGEE